MGEKKSLVLFTGDKSFSSKQKSLERLSETTSKGLKRTNFQLQDVESPQSFRKSIWSHVISFPSAL